MKGIMTTHFARRLGYTNEVLELAASKGYIEVYNNPIKPSVVVLNKIVEMIGDAPRCIYA
jgi:hypothetical protein